MLVNYIRPCFLLLLALTKTSEILNHNTLKMVSILFLLFLMLLVRKRKK